MMTLRMLRPGNGEPNKCVSVYNHSMNMSYTRIHTHVVSCVSCAFVCTRPLASAVRFDATKHTITTQRLNDGSEATNIGRPSSETQYQTEAIPQIEADHHRSSHAPFTGSGHWFLKPPPPREWPPAEDTTSHDMHILTLL